MTPATRAADVARPTALVHVLVLSAVATLVVSVWVLVDLGGWEYYSTPLRVRGYTGAHRVLRPSAPVGHWLGIVGLAMMTFPVLYGLRKRLGPAAWAGSMPAWLNVHIFCGVVGPVLVTFHTSFRFNGVISVAYWSMVAVVLSGFVGRYLYVRIPKSIRGTELGFEEIRERADQLKRDIEAHPLAAVLLDALAAFERDALPAAGPVSLVGYVTGQMRVQRRMRALQRHLPGTGADPALLREVLRVEADRARLLVRLAYLERTKRLFAAWHVFHQPLVYLMFAIAALHVGVAIYMGYARL